MTDCPRCAALAARVEELTLEADRLERALRIAVRGMSSGFNYVEARTNPTVSSKPPPKELP